MVGSTPLLYQNIELTTCHSVDIRPADYPEEANEGGIDRLQCGANKSGKTDGVDRDG